MIQSISFTSAAFEAFAEAYLCFLVYLPRQKNAETWPTKITRPDIMHFAGKK